MECKASVQKGCKAIVKMVSSLWLGPGSQTTSRHEGSSGMLVYACTTSSCEIGCGTEEGRLFSKTLKTTPIPSHTYPGTLLEGFRLVYIAYTVYTDPFWSIVCLMTLAKDELLCLHFKPSMHTDYQQCIWIILPCLHFFKL